MKLSAALKLCLFVLRHDLSLVRTEAMVQAMQLDSFAYRIPLTVQFRKVVQITVKNNYYLNCPSSVTFIKFATTLNDGVITVN